MHNRLIRWLVGAPPEMVGVYWGDHGCCFVHQTSTGEPFIAYEPTSKAADAPIWDSVLRRFEAISGIPRRDISLAIALSADDVFLRTISVPPGLSDAQLDQIAIVEAVANLPVPPEEICLDFVRQGDVEKNNEQVGLAFCRRERIDEILACAEEVSVRVWVVDRDVQAIHDALIEELAITQKTLIYPFGILLTERSPRLVICLSPTTIEAYPIGHHQSALEEEIANCWIRCRMSRPATSERLERIVFVGNALEQDSVMLKNLSETMGVEAVRYAPRHIQKKLDTEGQIPSSEVFLVALGMAHRRLS